MYRTLLACLVLCLFVSSARADVVISNFSADLTNGECAFFTFAHVDVTARITAYVEIVMNTKNTKKRAQYGLLVYGSDGQDYCGDSAARAYLYCAVSFVPPGDYTAQICTLSGGKTTLNLQTGTTFCSLPDCSDQ